MFKRFMGSRFDTKYSDAGLLILRAAAGIIFIFHGYGKLFTDKPGMDTFTMMVDKLGFPAPALFAYLAALSEFVGGLALLLGIWTTLAGTLTAIVMLVAITGVKKLTLPQADPDLALLAMSVAIALMGPGKYSVEAKMKR